MKKPSITEIKVWAKNWRRRYWAGQLTEEQIRESEKVGFTWGTIKGSFLKRIIAGNKLSTAKSTRLFAKPTPSCHSRNGST